MNATEILVESIANLGGISNDDAASVARLYIDEKIVRIGSVDGGFRAVHGSYFDRDVIERAVALTKEG